MARRRRRSPARRSRTIRRATRKPRASSRLSVRLIPVLLGLFAGVAVALVAGDTASPVGEVSWSLGLGGASAVIGSMAGFATPFGSFAVGMAAGLLTVGAAMGPLRDPARQLGSAIAGVLPMGGAR